jgi:hypothetical protein
MPDLSPELQELVLAGRSVNQPTAADFDRVLLALQTRFGAAAAASGAPATVPKGLLGTIGGKAIGLSVLGLALVFGGVATYSLRDRGVASNRADVVSGTEVVVPPSTPDAMPILESATQTPAMVESPLDQSKLASTPVHPRESSRGHDRLSQEVAILSRAETELHSGRAGNALKLLNEHEQRFRNGILTEERTAARIQALCALGRVADANAQLSKLRPGSLHGDRSQQACASGR